jgi:hypothetical protein
MSFMPGSEAAFHRRVASTRPVLSAATSQYMSAAMYVVFVSQYVRPTFSHLRQRRAGCIAVPVPRVELCGPRRHRWRMFRPAASRLPLASSGRAP